MKKGQRSGGEKPNKNARKQRVANGRRQGRFFEFRPASVRFPDALAPWAFDARCCLPLHGLGLRRGAGRPDPPAGLGHPGRGGAGRRRGARAPRGGAVASQRRGRGRRDSGSGQEGLVRAGCCARASPPRGSPPRRPRGTGPRSSGPHALAHGARAECGRSGQTPGFQTPGRGERLAARGRRPNGGPRAQPPRRAAHACPGSAGPARARVRPPHRRVPINHTATAMSSGRPAGAHRRILSRRPSRRARRPLIAPAGPGSARARRLTAHPSPQTRADGGPGGTAWPLITAPAASDGQGDGASRRQPALRPPRHPFPGACCPQETGAGQGLDEWTPFYSQRACFQTPRGRARLGQSRKPAPRIPVAQPCLHLIEEGARGQQGPAQPSWK